MEKRLVIVGSGIAGLSVALKLSGLNPNLKIILITKSTLNECNTRYAQGGIAAVFENQKDTFKKHINDTLACGRGLCNKEVVKMVVEQAPSRISELIQWGTNFDKSTEHLFDLALEGGHSEARVLHHKDKTGWEIERSLIAQILKCKNIQLLEHHSAIDLTTQIIDGETICTGIKAVCWKNNTVLTLPALKIIIATGGCGQVYYNTTNPKVANGDGYAMAARAGAKLRDMHFMQFHPSAFYSPQSKSVSFLISEAVRGFGAHVIDKQGKRFLFKYDVRGELATRDVVSSAIVDYLSHSDNESVFLDFRHLDSHVLVNHFPHINSQLLKLGFNFVFDLIPIMPAAHYQCGGIVVNKYGESSLKNLFAIGEVSSTGLHGANRLASNSLLEALVYAHNASEEITNQIQTPSFSAPMISRKMKLKYTLNKKTIAIKLNEIKLIMTSSAFQCKQFLLLKDRDHLNNIQLMVEEDIRKGSFSREIVNLRNTITTAMLILQDKINSNYNKQYSL